jgi:hypothetical protein
MGSNLRYNAAGKFVLRTSKAERPPQGQPRLAIWKPWDRIVYWMEEGMLAFLVGRYDESISALLKAGQRAEELFTRSIRRTHILGVWWNVPRMTIVHPLMNAC